MTSNIMTRNLRRTAIAAFNIALLCSGLLNTSCRFEDEDLFDVPAGKRVQTTNLEIKKILTSASEEGQNGWVIQYFVGGTDDKTFPGYNMLGKFYENGKVVLASDHPLLRDGNAGKFTTDSSYYELTAEDGCVLSFNTWNDILTVLEDPVDPTVGPGKKDSEEGGEDGVGIRGDHNLLLRKLGNDVIEFRGQRHQALVRFVRCDRPWEQYLSDVKSFKAANTSAISDYYVISGKDTMYFHNLNSGVFTMLDRLNDPLQIETYNCAFTPNGFYMGSTAKLKETEFNGFTLNEEKTCMYSEDKAVQLIACWDQYVLSSTEIWELDETLFNPELQALFDQVNTAIKKYNTAWSLKSLGLGKSTGGSAVSGLVFTFYTNTQKTKTNTTGIALTLSRSSLGQTTITCAENAAYDKNTETIEKKSVGFTAACRQCAAYFAGTYVMTPDSYFAPTAVTYKEQSRDLTFKTIKPVKK